MSPCPLISWIDLGDNAVTTWLGTGKSDEGDGTAKGIGFYEPGGISIAGGTLYVADTNHHRIVAVDIETKQPRVIEIRVEGEEETRRQGDRVTR